MRERVLILLLIRFKSIELDLILYTNFNTLVLI